MLNHEETKITGIVTKEIGEKNALIKVLSITAYANKPHPDDFVSMFPPYGLVFGPSFFKRNTAIVEGNIIDFECEENDKYTGIGSYTKYIVKDGSVCKSNYIKTYHISALPLQGKYANIDAINRGLIDQNSTFCISDNHKIMGKLRLLPNGTIEPVVKKQVYVWDRASCDFISDGHFEYLKFPDKDLSVYDCMSESNLFEWFREKFRQINPKYVKILDDTTDWRKDFPNFFDNSDEESLELDQYRFERIKNQFSGMELSVNEIKSLYETSEPFRQIFDASIKQHINSFKSEYEKDLVKFEKKHETEKLNLERELKEIGNKISDKKNQLKGIEADITKYQTDLIYLAENKKRILSDFLIFNDIIKTSFSLGNNNTDDSEASYCILETIEPDADSPEISIKNEFVDRIKYFLNQYNLNPNLASKLLKVFTLFQGVIIADIAYGVALAKALGNTKYIIQQVEPDWLRFKKFWENGLSKIWSSSHENPNIPHLLLLEDINLASPECYARPLIDIMHGIRDNLPYANSGVPKNLKIMATIISYEDPPIGLPIYHSSFKDWGAFGFEKKNINDTHVNYSLVDGHITLQTLEKFIPDEFERENIKSDMEIEYKHLFANQ